MKNSLDQGTVIYGIKSDKYPAFPCYGIIITARCDIAQNKVPKYHYLVAVDASSWFSSKHGYQLVYSKTIADKMKTVCDKATALELDGQTLLSTSTEQLEIILQDKKQQLHTLFRNSPAIVDFCASIAASGTLMFGAAFSNPYGNVQYHFTHAKK